MAANSDIRMCNMALAKLGGALITDFDEGTKASRLCKVLYPMLRDELISEHSWSCMRKVAVLSLLDAESDIGTYVYQLPADCILPIDLLPLGSVDAWHLVGSTVVTNVADASLIYTYSNTNPETFNWPFMRALISRLIVYLAPGIKGDSESVEKLTKEAEARVALAKTDDANIGSEYTYADNDANNDTFVNPDGSVTSA